MLLKLKILFLLLFSALQNDMNSFRISKELKVNFWHSSEIRISEKKSNWVFPEFGKAKKFQFELFGIRKKAIWIFMLFSKSEKANLFNIMQSRKTVLFNMCTFSFFDYWKYIKMEFYDKIEIRMNFLLFRECQVGFRNNINWKKMLRS